MNFIKQTITIFIICFIGEIISMVIPAPFPGSVIAMVILFFCLISGIVGEKKIRDISDFLLKNMSLLFIPATVSIVDYADILGSVIWQFLFICILTTIITFVCTAYSVKIVMLIMKRLEERRERNA